MLRLVLVLIVLFHPVFGAGATEPGRWLRDPTLAPDGKSIAFTYGGDIYRVAIEGGLAVPLTRTGSVESQPRFSPDGRHIAYSSDRNGTLDVYVLTLASGTTKRLTFHEANDVVTGFTAEGDAVLFESARFNPPDFAADPHQTQPELYSVSLEGGTPDLLTPVNAFQSTPDSSGGRLLYADQKGERFHRKHDDSPFARDVWSLDLTSGHHRRLTSNRWNDHTPAWAPDEQSFYFLSERSGTLNVWHQSLDAGEHTARQISFHETHPVRSLSVANNGTLVYGFDGEIYRHRADSNTSTADASSKRVPIELPATDTGDDTVVADVAGRVTEFELSPNDKEVAFVLRGDVYVTSLDFGTTRRITSTPGLEKDLSFSPDGRRLYYAAERFEQWAIFESHLVDEDERFFFNATRLEEEHLLTEQDGASVAVTQPVPAPDGRQIAYLSDWSEVRVFDRERNWSRTVVPGDMNYSTGRGGIDFSWSPDSKYLATDFQPEGRLFFSNIALAPADGSSEPLDLSSSGYLDTAPQWHLSGELISWATSRYGLRQHGGHGSLMDVYAQFLNQEAFDRFRRTKEELDLAGEDEGELPNDQKAGSPSEPAVVFDPVESAERQARLTIHSSDLAGFALDAEAARLYYLSAFEDGYDLWTHDFREQETKKLIAIGADSADLALTKSNDHVVILADGVLTKAKLGGPSTALEPLQIAVKPVVDAHAERQAMLHHIWQGARNHLYDPAILEEAQWDEMYQHYAGKLDHVTNNADFAAVARELVGELNISHTNSRYLRQPSEPTGALGAILDHSDQVEGIRIAAVLARGPLAKASGRVQTGHRIVAINDQELSEGANYYDLMRGRVGQRVRIALSDADERYEVIVKPATHREEMAWREEHWIETRHLLTEELSDGRLGYVYVPNMSDDTYRRIYSDIFGRHFAKEGIVIDVRDNRGGDLVTWLITLFSGRQYTWNIPDGREAQGEPLTQWVKAKIALTNQGAYSDGHCFVTGWKNLHVSTVVGTPVTGTCTYAGWEGLVSGDLFSGTPTLGIKDADGDWLERKTTWPDVTIYPDPNKFGKGDDAMLAKAVETLLKELDTTD
ncbi:MAG: S41 family peptidase [Pseudomonadota bacterium]